MLNRQFFGVLFQKVTRKRHPFPPSPLRKPFRHHFAETRWLLCSVKSADGLKGSRFRLEHAFLGSSTATQASRCLSLAFSWLLPTSILPVGSDRLAQHDLEEGDVERCTAGLSLASSTFCIPRRNLPVFFLRFPWGFIDRTERAAHTVPSAGEMSPELAI